MLTSFYSGLTGLSAYSNALNIVGNNLANINTAGFKSSSICFSDMVTASFSGVGTNGAGNPMQIGLGTSPYSVDGIFSQGSIQNTAEATNVAIEGNGFFIVGDTPEERFYTRAGNFSFNSAGYLINPSGKFLLGYTELDANGDLVTSGDLNTIHLPANILSDPMQTSFTEIFANLNVRDDIADTYSVSATVFDSKGAPHTTTIDFTHTSQDPDSWTFVASISDADITVASSTGSIQFDGSGQLSFVNGTAVGAPYPNTVQFDFENFTNGAEDMSIDWRLTDENGVGLFTGFPIPSAISSTNTDGYPPGNLSSIIIEHDGIVQGVFTNGQVEEIAQLATATFNNNRGLLRVGGNLFSETNSSGEASIGSPGSGGRGVLSGNALESSNVDLATEFTNMLIFERGYQANSRIIRTSDEVIQEALSLKR